MTQDQQGRWRMGPREWIAFWALMLAVIAYGLAGIVWMVKLDAKVTSHGTILHRLDDKREGDGALVQRVGDIERRLGSLEGRTYRGDRDGS